MKLIQRDYVRGERQIADLLAAYEMYRRFPADFRARLEEKCKGYKLSLIHI